MLSSLPSQHVVCNGTTLRAPVLLEDLRSAVMAAVGVSSPALLCGLESLISATFGLRLTARCTTCRNS
jgi:hypothetical protein